MQGVWIQSLVEELGSHMLHGAAREKKKGKVCILGFVRHVTCVTATQLSHCSTETAISSVQSLSRVRLFATP